MRRIVAFVLTVLVAGGLGFGAGFVILRDEEVAPVEAEPATVTVETGSVGRSLNFAASVDVESVSLATNVLPGVVTYVADHQVFSAGQTLYEIGDLPVVLAPGDLPFYRDLSPGMRGPDVKQLNAFLNTLGFPGAVDSDFGPIAEKNVRAWQKATGQPITGTVQLGQLVAGPNLPAQLTFDRKVLKKGALLAGGETLVFAPAGTPRVFLVLNESQQALLPAEAHVRLTSGEQEWTGEVGESRKDEESSTYEVEIRGPGGGALCEADCEGLAPGSELQATIDIVPQVTGPLVPRSAIMTDASGATYVVDATGTRHDVEVLGASQGLAVVNGIDAGSEIRVFGEES